MSTDGREFGRLVRQPLLQIGTDVRDVGINVRIEVCKND